MPATGNASNNSSPESIRIWGSIYSSYGSMQHRTKSSKNKKELLRDKEGGAATREEAGEEGRAGEGGG